ncbi:APC family permease [Halococcus sp. IIIV-5B]|uniref:APC family permease n=1 Tax=Halococcus sp. IIIV-5B TaxID=2321230 RepID=UPI000E763CBF|nr:APC family permease [Halococcus sp. IIIV-5B]RJT04886.1 amino acid permease [Halococcus sp. IIIV-5B]
MSDELTEDVLQGVLSRWQLFAIGFGAIVGWGWIIQMGYWIDAAGPVGATLAFAGGGLLVVFVSLVYAELVSAMPYAGGEHHYSLRAFGPKVSFACSWGLLLGYVGVVAFQSIALGVAVSYLIPDFRMFELWTILGQPVYGSVVAVGLLGVVGVTALNYRGVRPTAQLQLVLAAVVAFAGLVLVTGSLTIAPQVSNPPFAGVGLAGASVVAIQVPGLFVGFDVIPQAAEEADTSPRSLAIVVLLTVVTVGVFYIVSIWSAGQVLPAAVLGESPVPAAAAMTAVFDNPLAGKLMTLAGIAALLTSWSAFLIGASRVIFAMADSGMLPTSLATIHPEYNTPSRAVLLIGGVTALAPWLGSQMISSIINANSLGIVFAWILVSASFLYLRYDEPEMDRPFELPAGYLFGGLALVGSVAFFALYLPGAPSALVWPKDWAIVLVWAIFGLVLYSISRASTDATVREGTN